MTYNWMNSILQKAVLPSMDVERANRIEGVGRKYLLFSGPPSFDDFLDFPDLDSTYIGASEDCIERLLSHSSLEVLRTTSDAPVHMGADTINL